VLLSDWASVSKAFSGGGVKGRNRDTAWVAMLDSEWPQIKRRMQRWLDEENFDEHGRQRRAITRD